MNFISEILSLAGILLISKSCNLIFLFLGLLINTFYNFYFYSRLAFGNFTVALNNSSQLFSFNLDLNKNEFFVYIGLAILFQPFVKIALGRALWNLVDVVVGILLLLSLLKNTKKPNLE